MYQYEHTGIMVHYSKMAAYESSQQYSLCKPSAPRCEGCSKSPLCTAASGLKPASTQRLYTSKIIRLCVSSKSSPFSNFSFSRVSAACASAASDDPLAARPPRMRFLLSQGACGSDTCKQCLVCSGGCCGSCCSFGLALLPGFAVRLLKKSCTLFSQLSALGCVQSSSSLQGLGRLRRGTGRLGNTPAFRLPHRQVRRQLGVPVFDRA